MFAAEKLDDPPSRWSCVGCAQAPASASATFDLPAEPSGRSALFFKVYRTSEDVTGLTLADLLDNE